MFNMEHKGWIGFEKHAYRNVETQRFERLRLRGLEMFPVTQDDDKVPNFSSSGAQLPSFLQQNMPTRRGIHRLAT